MSGAGSRLEVETKLELDADGYRRVLESGEAKGCVEQLNVYYDRDWTLADAGAGLRVRYETGAAPVLTLKLPVRGRAGPRAMREWDLSRGEARRSAPRALELRRDLPEALRAPLLQLGIERLLRVGWSRNLRWRVRLDEGVVELDRLRLPDGSVVHEVEVEEEDPARHTALVERLREIVPSVRPSDLGKFERFRRAVAAPTRRS